MSFSMLSHYPVSPHCPDDMGQLLETKEGIHCTSCGRRFHQRQGLLELLPSAVGEEISAENEELTRYSSSFSQRAERSWYRPVRTALNLLGNAYLYRWAKREVERLSEKPGMTILDAACGDGTLRDYIPQVHPYVGIDFSTRLLLRALRHHPAFYFQADLNHLPFAEAGFDLVISLQALQYLNHPEQALSEFARVLKPSGTLLLSIPNADSIKYRIQGLASIQVQHFDAQRVESLLSSHFQIQELQTRGMWIPIPQIPIHLAGAYDEKCGLSWTIRASLRA